MTLYELTGKESGIIVYENNSVAAVNWLDMGDNQFPMLSPFGCDMIGWPEDSDVFANVKKEHVDDFRVLIPGSIWLTGEVSEDGTQIADTNLDIVYDPHNDFLVLFVGDPDYYAGFYGASVYRLTDDKLIICPDLWD